MIARRLRTRVNSVPPKESPPVFSNRERTPPPKLPLTAILSLTRFTLYLPFLFGFLFGNERVNSSKNPSTYASVCFLKKFANVAEVVEFFCPRLLRCRTCSIHFNLLSARLPLVLCKTDIPVCPFGSRNKKGLTSNVCPTREERSEAHRFLSRYCKNAARSANGRLAAR